MHAPPAYNEAYNTTNPTVQQSAPSIPVYNASAPSAPSYDPNAGAIELQVQNNVPLDNMPGQPPVQVVQVVQVPVDNMQIPQDNLAPNQVVLNKQYSTPPTDDKHKWYFYIMYENYK